ncbi:hypothetical protein [Paracoccus siganidrum]|nr:hypothetical protein [Paracoccus siganidrum]
MREAISVIPDRDEARHFRPWYLSPVWPQHPPQRIFAGILKAMERVEDSPPDLPLERLGYEILDGDGSSVTHTCYDAVPVDPERLGASAGRLAVGGKWLLAIDRVIHPCWRNKS